MTTKKRIRKQWKKTGRKLRKRIGMLCLALLLFAATAASASAQSLVGGGKAVGIQMSTDGVVVAGICSVETAGGEQNPAGDGGLLQGDVITKLGETEITSAPDFVSAAAALTGEPVNVTVNRKGEVKTLTITPAKTEAGEYRLGLWLRDGVTGVGTLTFYDPETGVYGALGHGITDTDSGILLPLSQGQLTNAKIVGVVKGKAGAPGELSGCGDGNSVCGNILMNTEYGIFGVLTTGGEGLGAQYECGEMKTGPATILATVSDDVVKEYKIEINRSFHDQSGERVMITVCDDGLLSATGGIVQGMSGSPIIQNGKLVGAVTHVFVNDPTKGYGLSITQMIAEASKCALDPAA